MKHNLKLTETLIALVVLAACASDDTGGDTAAGSSSSAGDTIMAMTTAADGMDDGMDDGMGTTAASGPTMSADSTGDTAADTTSGDTAGESTAGDTMGESGSGSTGAATGATVTGTVFRNPATAPGLGQDAIGDIYLGLLISCDEGAAAVANTVVLDGDLSDTSFGVPYTIENVPNGTYFLAGFMDDNDNTDPDDPDADLGDLAAAEGFGPLCTQVDIADGTDVSDADLTLNIVVPF